MRGFPLRVLATIAALIAATTLAACGVSRGVTGNDTGGIIQATPMSEAHAGEIASEYCARYNKYARITSDHPRYGDYIAFSCTWRPDHRPY
jgi:hypothetical protein